MIEYTRFQGKKIILKDHEIFKSPLKEASESEMSDPIQLRACPFCGSEELDVNLADAGGKIASIECNDGCGAELNFFASDKKHGIDKRKMKEWQAMELNKKLVNQWNTRAKNI